MYLGIFVEKIKRDKITRYGSRRVSDYKAYFKYDDVNDIGTYVIYSNAFRSDEYLQVITFDNTFDYNRDIFSYYYNYHNNALLDILYDIGQKEIELFNKNREELVKRFQNPSKIITKLFKLKNLNDALSIVEARKNFKEKINEILYEQEKYLNLNKSYKNKKADIYLDMEGNKDHSSLKLKIGYEKLYTIKSFSNFLEEFEFKENVKFGKFLTLKVSEEMLTERALRIINCLYMNQSRDTFSTNSVDSPLIMVKMIQASKGNNMTFNGRNYFISNNEIEGKVTFDENSNLKFTPALESSIHMVSSGTTLINFLDKSHEVEIINFENEAQLELFKINASVRGNFDVLDDLIDDNFSNFIKKSIKPDYKINEDNKLKINLYISLDMQKNIVFKTVYLYEDQETLKENITKNSFYETLFNEYELRLQELNFLENGKTNDLEVLNAVISSDYSRLKQIANVYLSDDILNMKKTKLGTFKITASSQKNRLSVQVSSDTYSSEDIKKILSAYKKKKKYVLLKGNFVSLDETEKLDELIELNENFDLSKDMSNSNVPFYQAFKLVSYEDKENLTTSFDEKIKNIILDIKNFQKAEISLSQNLLEQLRPYQIDAIKRMYTLNKNGLSGILADDMGLGKTFEFISFRTLINEVAPTLIVCPKSLIYNRKQEFKKRDPKVKCHVLSGTKQERLWELAKATNTQDVVIVSYDSLKNDLESFKATHFAIVCLDEAQYIKNSFTKKSQAVKQLDATSRFALTGTPIENALTDLWSIFDFLMPNYLSTENNFTAEYVKAFESNEQELKNKLLSKITPFILRRSKNDVLTDLPPKTQEVITIAMSEKQSELYNAYIKNTQQTIQENPKNKLMILSALTRMRQICVDPCSFVENFNEVSPKLEHTVNLVLNAIKSDHKVLLFSQFTSVLEHLNKLLKKEKIDADYICGDTKATDRIKISEEFNSNESHKVILVSLKAGGTGLNLYGADTVVHLDPWRNYAVEDQATDRAHRIGQTRPVTVYKLVAHDSIEEKVIELQESKKDLYDQVIQNGTENISGITDEDIKFLLS